MTSVRIVVADAGLLIALGRLDTLHLLPALFNEILVMATVLAECAARPCFIDAQRIGLLQAGGHYLGANAVQTALCAANEDET